MVAFPGPGVFSVMVFPVCRLVNEVSAAPVKRNVVDPSAALRILVNSSLTREGHPDLEPAERGWQGKGLA
jgi:hypothetical protein